MISEHAAHAKWRNLFGNGSITAQTLQEADELLEQLPPESPLRSRLTNELDEIRRLQQSRQKAAK